MFPNVLPFLLILLITLCPVFSSIVSFSFFEFAAIESENIDAKMNNKAASLAAARREIYLYLYIYREREIYIYIYKYIEREKER